MRTVAPLGTWYDMLFSEEMYNAQKYGYKFDILWGYIFNSENVFQDYVTDLYQLRLDYPKSDPMNYIAKLFLNSLYGKFGMNDNFTFCDIIPKDQYDNFIKDHKDNIIEKDLIDLDENYLVQSRNSKKYLDNENKVMNVNVAISAAITAYARIHMSQYKNDPNFKLFYTDTDSTYTNAPLPDHLVSDTILGKMKLERICSKAIFLAPKVYALLEQNGKEIIKIKGLTKESMKNVNIEMLESLLINNSKIDFTQNKWYRSLVDANISIKDQIYTLKVTGNKRQLVYVENKLVSTKPFIINEDKHISNNIVLFNDLKMLNIPQNE